MMTYSQTITNTFTTTDAQYLASRIATDLRQIKMLYGMSRPTDQDIENYAVEAGALLYFGLLSNVKYGYKRNGYWVLMLEYSTNYLGQLQIDSAPGGVIPGANISGSSWYTHLIRRSSSHSADQISAINSVIPVSRTDGEEPKLSGGQWGEDKSYVRNDVGLQRKMYWNTA